MDLKTISILAVVISVGVALVVVLLDRAFQRVFFDYLDAKLGPVIRTREEEVAEALEKQRMLFDERTDRDRWIQRKFRRAALAADKANFASAEMRLVALNDNPELFLGARGFPRLEPETMLEGLEPFKHEAITCFEVYVYAGFEAVKFYSSRKRLAFGERTIDEQTLMAIYQMDVL